MPAVCLSVARLEASDVGALVREAHPCGGGLVRGGQVGVPKRGPALRGLQLCGLGVVCRVEDCAEWVRCLGMQIRSEFNLNLPNSLRILSQREFAANSA